MKLYTWLKLIGAFACQTLSLLKKMAMDLWENASQSVFNSNEYFHTFMLLAELFGVLDRRGLTQSAFYVNLYRAVIGPSG